MAGQLALRAEIVAGFHQPGAEKLLPEAIHRDARRQRMFRRDTSQRARSSRVAPAFRVRRLQRRKDRPARAGSTFSPGLSYCPRIITKLSRGVGRSLNTNVP